MAKVVNIATYRRKLAIHAQKRIQRNYARFAVEVQRDLEAYLAGERVTPEQMARVNCWQRHAEERFKGA